MTNASCELLDNRRNQISSCIKKMDESDELIIPDRKGLEFLLRNAWLNVSKAPIANCLFLIDCF